MNPFAHDRRFEVGNCLQCDKHLDGVSGHKIDPYPGAIMVCAGCSYVMEWDGEKLVELSAELMKELEGQDNQPELKAALVATKLLQGWPKAVRIIVRRRTDG